MSMQMCPCVPKVCVCLCVSVHVCLQQTRTKDESQSWQNALKIGGERSRAEQSGGVSEGSRFWRNGDNYRDVKDSVSFPA